MFLRKVISGGQTGADIGGLLAAQQCGIRTGGNAPKDFRTEDGPKPSLKSDFGLSESHTTDYNARTLQNVLDSSVTIIVATDSNSAGTKLTRKTCIKRGRLYMLIHPDLTPAFEVVQFLRKYRPVVLNVAGNRESVSPGIARKTCDLLTAVFTILQQEAHPDPFPSDAYVDKFLDNVLKAAGSALKYYTEQKTLAEMRKAMREAMVGWCTQNSRVQEPVQEYFDIPHFLRRGDD